MKEIYKDCIGKTCLVRSYDAGVYYGTVTDIEGETVRVENVRNIWRWEGANCLSDIADHGIKREGASRISIKVGSMILNRVCQIIPMTDAAIKNLDRYEPWTR
jgi:hypothetical protein